MRKVQQLMNRLMTYAPVDAAADQMAKKYIHDSLPPVLTEGSCLEQPCLLFLPPVFCLLAFVYLTPFTQVALLTKSQRKCDRESRRTRGFLATLIRTKMGDNVPLSARDCRESCAGSKVKVQTCQKLCDQHFIGKKRW